MFWVIFCKSSIIFTNSFLNLSISFIRVFYNTRIMPPRVRKIPIPTAIIVGASNPVTGIGFWVGVGVVAAATVVGDGDGVGVVVALGAAVAADAVHAA